MKMILLLVAAFVWALYAFGVRVDKPDLIWLGAALIVAGEALGGAWPWAAPKA